MTRRRIVVATADTLTAKMAGPAIRAWHIASALHDEHDVRLVTTSACDIEQAPFSVSTLEPGAMERLIAWADIVVIQGYVMHDYPALRKSNKVIVVDLYDPIHLEQLESAKDNAEGDRRHIVHVGTEVMNQQLIRGDFFMCASEKQRDFWLGSLAALGRLNPIAYDADETMRGLIDVVPFGVEAAPPEHRRDVLRGVVPGIGRNDDVILWGGGIYNWFDPLTLLRAIDKLRWQRPNIRVYFLGLRHPNPNVPTMRMAVAARSLSDELGLTDRHAFFNEDWVDYDDRANYLLEADVGVSIHLDHVETAFSFRTRVLDYIWAGLPVVVSGGDSLAAVVEDRGLGLVVEPGDVDMLASSLETLLLDDGQRDRARAAAHELRSSLTWERALAPLVGFCREARRAPDLVDPEAAARLDMTHGRIPGRKRALREELDAIARNFREGGFRQLATRAKERYQALEEAALIVALAGGVGAARMLSGLLAVVPGDEVTAIVNTGDDVMLHGLHVSPDLDTVTYTLAGAMDPERGWGLAGESWVAMDALERYRGVTWFRLGDRDLATHLYRTQRLAEGATLSQVTTEIAAAWGLDLTILPMTDQRVETRVEVDDGEIGFQEYFVQRRHAVPIHGVRFAGVDAATPGVGVLEAIAGAERLVICPSNPIVSIAPILAVPGVRDAVEQRCDAVAISPIVAGAALKGPADRMLKELGHEASVVGIARLYAGLARVLVIDEADRELAGEVEASGMRCVVAPTVMRSASDAAALATVVLDAVTITVIPIAGFPEVRRGDSLAEMIAAHASLADGDVVVVTQKVVSKAEGRLVAVDPDDALAHKQLVEEESVRVLRRRGDLIISETAHGFVCANAGVDISNVELGSAALLPRDSDRSARRIRDGLLANIGVRVGVIVSDTFGRPWRRGLTDVAIGCAGVAAISDLRGTRDSQGRELQVTEVAVADEIAAAAELVMGKAAGIPVAVVRGVNPDWLRESSVAAEIVRRPGEDLFR